MMVTSFISIFAVTFLAFDHFDAHAATVIQQAIESNTLKPIDSLTAPQLRAIAGRLEGHPGASLVVVRTDQNALTKILTREAQLPERDGKPVTPFFLFERVVTFPDSMGEGLQVDGKDIYMFDGFCIDLDSGKIVPKGHGEDVVISISDKGLTLSVTTGVRMYVAPGALTSAEAAADKRSNQGPVTPADFSGEYSLEADGRWSGSLSLKVDEDGAVTGEYKSGETGKSFPVNGQVGRTANRIEFTVEFPMTKQKFEGYLWTRGRDKMSGVTHMLDQPFGFHATRK
jgi:hypothetical protein